MGTICWYRFLHGTVTKVTTVSTVNFICIIWHCFVLNKYLQFLIQILADSHCCFSFSLCFLILTVFSVSHCCFSFSLCFQYLCSFWCYCYYCYYKEEARKSFFHDKIIWQKTYCELTKSSKGVQFNL